MYTTTTTLIELGRTKDTATVLPSFTLRGIMSHIANPTLCIPIQAEVTMSRYKAVIFDLWGTLVDELRYPETNRLIYQQKIYQLADLLGVERDGFARSWAAGLDRRMIGAFPSIQTAMTDVCRRLGAEPDEDRVQAAAAVRFEYIRDALSPRPGAVETMSTLRLFGYKIGVISNCSDEVSRLWNTTPFEPLVDAAVLSSDVGLSKPDPRIYELASERLGIAAEQCLYVGDGSSGELSGASKAGMTAVVMRAPYDQADGDRQGWHGDKASTIPDVLGLLGLADFG